MKLKKETDYNKFKFLNYNRDINQRQLNKIVDENRKVYMLDAYPIIVDSKMNIIDGQHRFEASKRLHKPIWYLQKNIKVNDILLNKLNTLPKNHNLDDKIIICVKYGYKPIKSAYNIWKVNKKIPLSVVVELLFAFASGGSTKNAIDNRKYKIKYKDEFNELVKYINSLNFNTEAKFKRPFVFAIAQLMKTDMKGAKKLKRILKRAPSSLAIDTSLERYKIKIGELLKG